MKRKCLIFLERKKFVLQFGVVVLEFFQNCSDIIIDLIYKFFGGRGGYFRNFVYFLKNRIVKKI